MFHKSTFKFPVCFACLLNCKDSSLVVGKNSTIGYIQFGVKSRLVEFEVNYG